MAISPLSCRCRHRCKTQMQEVAAQAHPRPISLGRVARITVSQPPSQPRDRFDLVPLQPCDDRGRGPLSFDATVPMPRVKEREMSLSSKSWVQEHHLRSSPFSETVDEHARIYIITKVCSTQSVGRRTERAAQVGSSPAPHHRAPPISEHPVSVKTPDSDVVNSLTMLLCHRHAQNS